MKPFNPETDILSLHYDHANDPDDVHSAVADRCVIDTLFSPEWVAEHVVIVTGTYGTNKNYVAATEPIMKRVWGHVGVINAHKNRPRAVGKAAAAWERAIEGGGRVHVKEGGQSDFSALVLQWISKPKKVRVVQHSSWNEAHTTPERLAYVKRTARYDRIPDANAYLRATGGDRVFERAALSSAWQKLWELAFAYLPPSAKLDFSDTGELLHILNYRVMNLARFQKLFLGH